MLILMKDLFGFLKTRKKYWLIPIVFTLLVIGAFIFLAKAASIPFIYTVF